MDLDHKGLLVDAGWVIRNLHNGIIIVDCRWDLVDKERGKREYAKGHIPGAYFVNMETELADLTLKNRGRHPIPETGKFANVVRRIGISDDSTVVCYDDDCSGSARMWFLLRYYGHDRVFILNGGIDSYIKAGGPLTRELPPEHDSGFTPVPRPELIATRDEIKTGGLNMVDVRGAERYRGEVEPIDPKKGHIPGAKNLPYTKLTENGRFPDRTEIGRIMSGIGENPVFYCGSGITSCVPLVVSFIQGKPARLYPGSWSEWVSFDDCEIETGNGK